MCIHMICFELEHQYQLPDNFILDFGDGYSQHAHVYAYIYYIIPIIRYNDLVILYNVKHTHTAKTRKSIEGSTKIAQCVRVLKI